jgi:hypothetical protein
MHTRPPWQDGLKRCSVFCGWTLFATNLARFLQKQSLCKWLPEVRNSAAMLPFVKSWSLVLPATHYSNTCNKRSLQCVLKLFAALASAVICPVFSWFMSRLHHNNSSFSWVSGVGGSPLGPHVLSPFGPPQCESCPCCGSGSHVAMGETGPSTLHRTVVMTSQQCLPRMRAGTKKYTGPQD